MWQQQTILILADALRFAEAMNAMTPQSPPRFPMLRHQNPKLPSIKPVSPCSPSIAQSHSWEWQRRNKNKEASKVSMKNQIIHITSLAKKTKVTIHNGKKVKRYWHPSIDDAVQFVLPRGSRHTTLFINGFNYELEGWRREVRRQRSKRALVA